MLESDLLRGHDCEHVPGRGIAGGEGPCREFNHAIGPESRRNAPGFNDVAGLHDRALAGDEGNIDWKAHEKRVNRVRRGDEHGATLRERGMSQQTDPPARGIKSGREVVRNHATVPRIANDLRARRRAQERSKKGIAHDFSCQPEFLYLREFRRPEPAR